MTTGQPPLDELGRMPRDDDGPVFSAPWEAQAFALAVRLHQEGHFTWTEWADALSLEIARGEETADRDLGLGSTYYHHWVAALERLCAEKGLLDPTGVRQRAEEWRRAYLNTPHGQPIELSAASFDRRKS